MLLSSLGGGKEKQGRRKNRSAKGKRRGSGDLLVTFDVVGGGWGSKVALAVRN